MSVNPVNSMSSLCGVSNKDLERMPIEMKWFFVQADRAQSLESLMDDRIDAFRGRTDRIRKLNELKGALQDLEALCGGKKPEDDISGVLSANPQLKARIDQLSAETGVDPFGAAQTTSTPATSVVDTSEDVLPATIPPDIGTYAIKYLEDEHLKAKLIADREGARMNTDFSDGEYDRIADEMGTQYRDKLLNFLASDDAKKLVEYLNAKGDAGVAKLTSETTGSTTSTASATAGSIQFGQIKSAFTRIDGQINAVSSEQQIDTMQLNSINQQRSACFESMSAALRTWKDLISTIFR